MTKRFAGLAAAVLALLVPGPAEATTSIRYHYVQPQFESGASTWLSRHDTPAGRVAPTGSFTLTPPTKTFRMTVNDVAARAGDTVFVWVHWQDGTGFSGCVPDGVAREFSGGSAGWVWVSVGSEFPLYGSACSVGPVAGTITVSY